MACSNCGSVLPCGCTTDCSSSQSSSSCCGNQVPATALPYYACAPACPEDHKETVLIQQFYTAVKIANAWNVPECGETAEISVPGVKNIVIGSYLWNEEFGYFEITAFNASTGKVTVINNCNENNAAAGTAVPSCSEFIISDPPAPEIPTTTPCVEIDFTAPDVGSCLDITLTTTTGILVGYNVIIGTGTYRVSEVKANNIINICNDGDGIAPGTPVIAKDAEGDYQYCLQIISSNPCADDSVDTGVVLVCSGERSFPINSYGQGWVLMCVDATTNEAEYRPLQEGLPTCTVLAAALNILAGTDGYNITVANSAVFNIGDVVVIDNYAGRFTISGFPDGTHIAGTFDPVPPANVTIPIDSFVCGIGCCEFLQNQIDDLGAITAVDEQDPVTVINLDSAGTTSVDTPVQTVTINNTTDRTMDVFFTLEADYDMAFGVGAGEQLLLYGELFFDPNDVTPTTEIAELRDAVTENTPALGFSRRIVTSSTLTVPANSSLTLNYFLRVSIQGIVGGVTANGSAFTKSSYIGVGF